MPLGAFDQFTQRNLRRRGHGTATASTELADVMPGPDRQRHRHVYPPEYHGLVGTAPRQADRAAVILGVLVPLDIEPSPARCRACGCLLGHLCAEKPVNGFCPGAGQVADRAVRPLRSSWSSSALRAGRPPRRVRPNWTSAIRTSAVAPGASSARRSWWPCRPPGTPAGHWPRPGERPSGWKRPDHGRSMSGRPQPGRRLGPSPSGCRPAGRRCAPPDRGPRPAESCVSARRGS